LFIPKKKKNLPACVRFVKKHINEETNLS
jgi:hypothetical protein